MNASVLRIALAAGAALLSTPAAAIPEGPAPNTAEWLARETANYAHVLEADAELVAQPDYLLIWTLRGSSNHLDWLQRAIDDPSWLSPLSGNTAVTPVAATWGAVATGDPTRYPDAGGPNGRVFYEQEAEVIPVVFYDEGCARISGRVWAPRGAKAGDRLPGVVIQNGSIQASETLYWWMAQPLVRAGYVVMTFDPRGQGRSDLQTPTLQQGGNFNTAVFSDGFTHIVDFFRSTPVAPYPNNLHCAGTYPTEVTAFNPFHDRIDAERLGVTGHSAGAFGISAVQGYPGERFAFPDARGNNPIDVIVAWDSLQFSAETPPRVPAMGQTSEYLVAAPPHVVAPDPEGHKGAYAGWVAAGVPVYQFTVAGSTHFDWSLLPGFPASSWCPDISTGSCSGGWGQPMIVHYTQAWLDRWLKQPGEPGYDDADARLLDDASWCSRYSVYSRAGRDFRDRGGKQHQSEDIRADCVAGKIDTPAAHGTDGNAGGGAMGWLGLLLGAVLAGRRRVGALLN
ncbi:MAG TPA: hypothetical protein VGE51_13325 [Fontimonas sp.]